MAVSKATSSSARTATAAAPATTDQPTTVNSTRRFSCVADGASKFWEVTAASTTMSIRFGRLGTTGQTQTKTFADAAAITKAIAKLISEKTSKGYVEDADETVALAPPAAAAAKVEDNATPSAPATVPSRPAKTAPTKTAPTKTAPTKTAPTKTAPAKRATPAVVNEREQPEVPAFTDGWVPAADGYHLTLRAGKVIGRNAKGKELATLPGKIADSPVGEQLDALAEWLDDHAQVCRTQVETWMLRSLPVAVRLIGQVWVDPAWRSVLENAVVYPCDTLGRRDGSSIGFLRGADPTRGLGLVTLDGETVWSQTAALLVPHPVLCPDLKEFQTLATELNLQQGIQQLLRETFTAREAARDLPATATEISRFAAGNFQQLSHATGRCRQLGYAVKGGYAICTVVEDGQTTTAQYWLGADEPTAPASTGALAWHNADEQPLTIHTVPPVAFSEGMRMAAAIYAKRAVEEQNSP